MPPRSSHRSNAQTTQTPRHTTASLISLLILPMSPVVYPHPCPAILFLPLPTDRPHRRAPWPPQQRHLHLYPKLPAWGSATSAALPGSRCLTSASGHPSRWLASRHANVVPLASLRPRHGPGPVEVPPERFAVGSAKYLRPGPRFASVPPESWLDPRSARWFVSAQDSEIEPEAARNCLSARRLPGSRSRVQIVQSF